MCLVRFSYVIRGGIPRLVSTVPRITLGLLFVSFAGFMTTVC